MKFLMVGGGAVFFLMGCFSESTFLMVLLLVVSELCDKPC